MAMHWDILRHLVDIYGLTIDMTIGIIMAAAARLLVNWVRKVTSTPSRMTSKASGRSDNPAICSPNQPDKPDCWNIKGMVIVK